MKMISIGASQLFIFIATSITSSTRSSTIPSEKVATYHHDDEIHPMTPNPNPYQIISPEDGTKSPWIYIKTRGDLKDPSHKIYEETADGFLVRPTANGDKYKYVNVDTMTGEFIETELIAGVANPYLSGVMKDGAAISQAIIRKNDEASRKLRSNDDNANHIQHQQAQDNDQEHHIASPRRRAEITSGTLKNLVVPFKFSDHTGRTLPSKQDLNVLMNSVNPDANLCPTGSVRDVFLKTSFNQLDLQSVISEWVTLDYTEAYCSNGESGLSTRIHTCLINALDKVVAAGVINFNEFDVDNNGIIDGMTFFHSGYAAEVGGTDAYNTISENRIWSHKWQIFQNWSESGVWVSSYHINPSVWGISGSDIGRIGVVAHETGHFLGLPDLYDYGSGEGIGSYGLMANSWGFEGTQYYPPPMSAWSKETLGWVTPTTISTSGSYSLRRACDYSDMIKIDAGYPTGEYLLIENRQPCAFDAELPQGGLAIFHIDDYANNVAGYPEQTGWPGNGNHYIVALVQAENYFDMEQGYNRGDGWDLFHGGNVNSIGPNGISTGSAYPNTKAYQDGNIINTDVTISNIGVSGDTMTFDITIGSATQSPVAAPVTPPTQSPVAAPVTPPTQSPVAAPVTPPTQSPVTLPVTSCVDSPLRFKLFKDGTRITRGCDWVANRATQMRCTYNGVADMCPATCNTCSNCVDPPSFPSEDTNGIRFKFSKDGKNIWRSCAWVRARSSTSRCRLTSNSCRGTCVNECQDPVMNIFSSN